MPLLSALASNANIYSDLEIEDEYFTAGIFQQDLTDIINMMKWAEAHEINKVRLIEL